MQSTQVMNDIELKQYEKQVRAAHEWRYREHCKDLKRSIDDLYGSYKKLWHPVPFSVDKSFRLILKILDALENQTSLKSKRR